MAPDRHIHVSVTAHDLRWAKTHALRLLAARESDDQAMKSQEIAAIATEVLGRQLDAPTLQLEDVLRKVGALLEILSLMTSSLVEAWRLELEEQGTERDSGDILLGVEKALDRYIEQTEPSA